MAKDEQYSETDLDLFKRKIETRLAYYESVLSQRDDGYQKLKSKVLPRLFRALEKIEDGTYGSCDDCGDLIPKPRLLAVPGATFCVSCQSEHEAG